MKSWRNMNHPSFEPTSKVHLMFWFLHKRTHLFFFDCWGRLRSHCLVQSEGRAKLLSWKKQALWKIKVLRSIISWPQLESYFPENARKLLYVNKNNPLGNKSNFGKTCGIDCFGAQYTDHNLNQIIQKELRNSFTRIKAMLESKSNFGKPCGIDATWLRVHLLFVRGVRFLFEVLLRSFLGTIWIIFYGFFSSSCFGSVLPWLA